MIYLQSVKGNIKGGIPESLPLYPKTLIYGHNGHGKSTVINAIELLLGGFATDVMGRDLVRKPSDLMVLKGTGKPNATLKLSGMLSDGSMLSYELRKTDKGAGRPKHLGPQGLTVRFPFQEVKEHLTGSAKTAQQWLSQQLPIENYLEVSSELRKLIYYHQDINPQATLLDILDIIKENSKRKIKDAKSAIKSSEKAIDLIGKEIQSVDKTHVEELKCESDLLLERIMAASNTVSKEELDALEKSIVDLQSSVDSVLTEISNIGDVQPLNDNEKAEIEKLMALRKIVLVNEHRDTCFVCDNSLRLGNPLSIDQIDRVLGGIQERLDKLKKRDEIIAHHDSGVRELKRMKAKYGQMLERQAGFTHDNKDALQEQYRKVRMEYENANQQLLDSNRVLKLRQQIADNQKIVDDNAELAKHAEQQISEAIKQAQDVFCDRVTKYLPKEQSSEFIMDLSDNHCRIGLKVLGVDCYAVSGAEWVIMVLAIAAAINEDQENVLNVFIPEERAYDPFTLESMMKSLANVQGQVFLTTTITPNTVPDGWEAIERFKMPF